MGFHPLQQKDVETYLETYHDDPDFEDIWRYLKPIHKAPFQVVFNTIHFRKSGFKNKIIRTR